MHPEFTANLDYEEYRAMKKVDDVNEGYHHHHHRRFLG